MIDGKPDAGRPVWERPGRFARMIADRDATEAPPTMRPTDNRTAEALYELCPPGYRNHEVLRRHPILLARMAHQHIEASLAALREGYSRARVDLREQIPVHAVEQVLAAYVAIGAELHRAARQVEAIERAIRSATPPAPAIRTHPAPTRGTIETMDRPQAHETAVEPRWIPDDLLDDLLADVDVTGDLAELQIAVTDERIYAHAAHTGDAATG